MANKKIPLLDASGMLTKEALLGYVYGGLPPETQAEIEQLLAKNEMLADMAEGIRHIPSRAEAEKTLNELNMAVATRSGSEASVPGIGENVSDFFWNYRRVAAVVGTLLLISAAVLTFALLKVSHGESEIAQKQEAPPQETTFATEQAERKEPVKEPVYAETPSRISGDTTLTASALDAHNDAAPISEDEIAAILQTGSPQEEHTESTGANEKKNKKEEKKKQAEVIAAQTQTARTDTADNQNVALANDAGGDNARERKDDLAKQEQTYQAEEAAALTKQGTLSNTSAADSYYKNVPLTTAEQMPAFPGGEAAFIQYLNNNMKYPQKAKADGVEGKVYLSFIIGTTGKVKEIAVIQGVSKEINAEAIRLIASMPKWEPGKQSGKPVAVQLYRTIEFKL